ncbi:MAG: LysR substrate-binding domain-containing protein [Clostridiaceae bacterium]
MDIRQIKVFSTVAKHLNFTKAADELYVTQSSISKIIKSLEDELGMVLFIRSPKIQLTDIGKEFYKKTDLLISLIESIPNDIQEVADLNRGTLTIGIPPITGSAFFPQIIGEFKVLYPNIEIRLIEEGSKKIEEMLERRELDLGVVCSLPKEPDAYHMMHYLKSPLRAGINVLNPLAEEAVISFQNLKDEPLILMQENFSLYDLIIHRCHENGFIPNIVCHSSQRDFIIEMVAANMGITFLPENICQKTNRPEIRFIPIEDPQIYLNLLVIWKRNSYLSFASKKWLEFAASKIGYPIDLEFQQ